ncbi:MAG: hypothetical protein RLZZ306_1752, partial [Bacteroidota bacterium]
YSLEGKPRRNCGNAKTLFQLFQRYFSLQRFQNEVGDLYELPRNFGDSGRGLGILFTRGDDGFDVVTSQKMQEKAKEL